jgi:LemA protein
MIDTSLLLWGTLAVLVFWALGAYNRLVRLRSRAIAAFVPVDAQFMQYLALVQAQLPQALNAAAAATLQLWQGLSGACQQFEASLAMVRLRPLDAPTMAPLHTAHETLRQSWLRVQAAAPDLAGALLPQSLQAQWEHIDAQLGLAAREFDDKVADYNEAVAQFPAVILAWLFSFKPALPVCPPLQQLQT